MIENSHETKSSLQEIVGISFFSLFRNLSPLWSNHYVCEQNSNIKKVGHKCNAQMSHADSNSIALAFTFHCNI